MGHYSEITISRSDAKKYSNVSYQGDKVTAKVYINDKGEITKDSYSRELEVALDDVLALLGPKSVTADRTYPP